MPTNPVRERNKALGRFCGNCGHGVDTADNRYVYCEEIGKDCNCLGGRCWYRKKKGGCAKWCAKTEKDNAEHGDKQPNQEPERGA